LKFHPDVKKIYMIGDNLKSDILGANTINEDGIEWISCAVLTGLYKGEPSDIVPKHTFNDFQAAVEFIYS
jgi:ribonucleotide monophosphatase NagD (HAD superfamily)